MAPLDSANWRCSSATNSNTTSIVQQRIREQITSSTFAFDISSSDPDKFVLIHSLNGKAYSTVTLWPQCNSFHLPFEVMGQVQGVSISILSFSVFKHGSDIVCLQKTL